MDKRTSYVEAQLTRSGKAKHENDGESLSMKDYTQQHTYKEEEKRRRSEWRKFPEQNALGNQAPGILSHSRIFAARQKSHGNSLITGKDRFKG